MHHKAMQEGVFEQLEVDWIRSELTDEDVFVDVGANAGYFSCLARVLGSRVVAVEPHPANIQILLENVRLNSGPLVEALPVAVGAEISVMRLHGLSSTGASLIANWAGSPAFASRLVPVTTLDNLLAGRFLDKRLIIKIDVEGFEYQVLRGAESLLDRELKPLWLVEITNSQFHPEGLNPFFEDTYREFWRRGYGCLALTEFGHQPVENGDFKGVERLQSEGVLNYIFSVE